MSDINNNSSENGDNNYCKNMAFFMARIGKFCLAPYDKLRQHALMRLRRRRLLCAKLSIILLILVISFYVFMFTAISSSNNNQQKQQDDDNVNQLNLQTTSQPVNNCTEKDKEICLFREQMITNEDRQLMALTLKHCSQALNHLIGTAYFLYGTSLVGYYRHNASMIPWEDFINIALFPTDPKLNVSSMVRQFHRLVKTLLHGDYAMRYDRRQRIIKCFGTLPTNSRRINSDPSIFWRWPYIEIQVMNVTRQTNSKIVTISDPIWTDFLFPGEMILPLKPVLFEGVSVFVPNDALMALERNYNPYTCRTTYYSHREERAIDPKMIIAKPCQDLRHFVNFTNLDFFADVDSRAVTCEIGRVKDDPLLCAFLPLLNKDEKKIVLKLLSITVEMLEQLEDAKYFLYSGTLIGYWRHNGSMIPWDDDVDMAVVRTNPNRNESFYAEQLEDLIDNYPGYTVYYMKHQGKVKIFGTTSQNSRKIGHGEDFEWRWPFVDVQLMQTEFDDDGKTIVNISDTSGFDSFWYPGELIFPLERAIFESLKVWVPANTEAVLKRNYNVHECTAPYYNHRFERAVSDERQVSRPCIQLTSLYSFTNIDDIYYDVS